MHLVTGGLTERTSYIRLTPELKVLTRTRIDDLGDTKTVASDGDLTLITSCRTFYDTPGPCFVATYDRRGVRIASRAIDGNVFELWNMHDDAAVVDGRAYVLLFREGALHVDELARDLTPIASSVLPSESGSHRDATLHSRVDRLVVDVPPVQYEFSTDLAEVKEVPRVAPPEPRWIGQAWCQGHVRVGPVDAFGCLRPGTGEAFVTWDRYHEEP
ncbi:MAG TPA: hypothetical protein VF765_08675 [Polyangiaceae bacterium]